jgi:hypothetical protein
MDLIDPVIETLAKDLNLTYQEMEQVSTEYFRLPEEQRTPEVILQLAEEMKQGKSQPQNNQ